MASLSELMAAKKAASQPSVSEQGVTTSVPTSIEPSQVLTNSVVEEIQILPVSETPISQETHEVIQRIRSLEALAEEDLKGAMDELKQALLQNPAATALLLPEDIGEMVAQLRRITGQACAEAAKPKKEKKKNLTKEELEAAWEEL